MTTPQFPILSGLGWSVHKQPTYSTKVATHVSGREVRNSLYAYPVYNFELTYDGLDSNGTFSGLGNYSLQTLMTFYMQNAGQYGTFVYTDPTDNVATNCQASNNNGGLTTGAVNEQFVLNRQFNNSASLILEPVGYVFDPTTGPSAPVTSPLTPTIKVGGTTISHSQYTIAPAYSGSAYTNFPQNVLTFTTAQTAGQTVTATFNFGFLCRFTDDNEDFENIMNGLWTLGSLKFKSVKI